MSNATSRTVEGESVVVGGVTVRVELDEGELSIRVGRVSAEAEGEKITISPETGAGHVNLYVDGETPGETQGTRYRVYQEGGRRRSAGPDGIRGGILSTLG